MQVIDYLILAYVISINGIGFVSMGIDKRKAQEKKWRISEKRLMMVAFLGGSIGSLLGMKAFRHKTRHKKFTIGIPLILILELLATLFVVLRFDLHIR